VPAHSIKPGSRKKAGEAGAGGGKAGTPRAFATGLGRPQAADPAAAVAALKTRAERSRARFQQKSKFEQKVLARAKEERKPGAGQVKRSRSEVMQSIREKRAQAFGGDERPAQRRRTENGAVDVDDDEEHDNEEDAESDDEDAAAAAAAASRKAGGAGKKGKKFMDKSSALDLIASITGAVEQRISSKLSKEQARDAALEAARLKAEAKREDKRARKEKLERENLARMRSELERKKRRRQELEQPSDEDDNDEPQPQQQRVAASKKATPQQQQQQKSQASQERPAKKAKLKPAVKEE
jgi:hypothetical protein